MELKTEGRRTYITGNTYPIRNQLRSIGAHWDADRKAWWTSKREAAQELLTKLGSAPVTTGAPEAEEAYDGAVLGKAEYKGRQYYVRWQGTTSRGTEAFRLVTLDGKVDFWADATACKWTKRYQKKVTNWRSDRETYPTLCGIRSFIAREKRETAATGIDCWMCRREEERGNLRMHLHDGCDVCGREG
ncbi:MAG: hypothetical protein ACREU9_00105 [Gammaproteobacteria bacterium]